MLGNFSAESFADGIGNFDTGGLSAVDQPSNWQANYWKHRSKKERDRDTLEERIRLGILPPELAEEAKEAVQEGVLASQQASAGINPGASLLLAIEAREAYDNIYRRAYKDAYIAAVVAELWKEALKREQRRRALALLLFH